MAETQAPTTSDREHSLSASGEQRTGIADGIVALLKHYYGRGPEQARAYL